MAKNLDQILDECIDRINRGESLKACLAEYPEYREQLEPLLRAMLQTQGAYSFAPEAKARREARQRFNVALARREHGRREKQSLFPRVFTWPRAWATVATVLVILVAGYFGLRFLQQPEGLVSNPEGNFVFLISDEVNAILDFDSLNITISKIGLQLSDDSGQWVEFAPEVREADLTLLQGDKTQEMWRGNVPEGQYTTLFIQVADVRGVLKESGQTVEVKLPSGKLHLSKSFQVTADAVTSFTYDLTVVATGSLQSGIKYILKPQADQSGAHHEPADDKAKGKQP